MSDTSTTWENYKQDILDQLGDFSSVYGELSKQKRSTDGWVTALCPFHEDSSPSFAYHVPTGNWKCHAECGQGSVFDFIVKRDGKEFVDVLLELGTQFGLDRPHKSVSQSFERIYHYCDADGQLLYQVIRGSNKKFRQRRPDGNGGWIWNLKDTRRVLYRLPDLLERPADTVFVCEGEKDVDRLRDIGLLATTNPGGSGKWRTEYNEFLRDRDVVILPDNDVPGRDHGQKVAANLAPVAKSVRVVELPGLPEKGDVSDWLDAGGTVDCLAELVFQSPQWLPITTDVNPTNRPTILTNGRQLRDIVDEAWTATLAVNDPPQLFRYGGRLARLLHADETTIDVMNEDAVHGHLMRVADWIAETSTGTRDTKPPRDVAKDYLVNPHPELPEIEEIVCVPVFDDAGKLIAKSGYHRGPKLWMHQPHGFVFPGIPSSPTEQDIEQARRLLFEDLLIDFPFTAESDESHALAALILPFARRLIPGCTPIHLIEAPTPGSGKSLLSDLISIIALGRPCEPTTVSNNNEETRKKVTALLASGAAIILLDNIRTQLDSSDLAAAMTAVVWKDRILGQSKMIKLPNRATWIVTANNPRLSLEIARRSIRIRIDPVEDRPWQRKVFKHDPIRRWTLDHRGELVRAVLVLVQSWLAADRPLGTKAMGSFEGWAETVGGILVHAGVSGFLEDTDEFYETADQEGQQWRAFIEAWWASHQTSWVTTKELHDLALTHDMLGFVLGDKSERSQKTRLGRALGTMRDRRFGEHKVIAGTDKHSRQARYRIVPEVVKLFSGNSETTKCQ